MRVGVSELALVFANVDRGAENSNISAYLTKMQVDRSSWRTGLRSPATWDFLPIISFLLTKFRFAIPRKLITRRSIAFAVAAAATVLVAVDPWNAFTGFGT